MSQPVRAGRPLGIERERRSVIMRVLIAGATGVVGRQLVPLLRAEGHEVAGTTRSTKGFGLLRELGARPVAVDLLDREAVRKAVAEVRPDAIVHQATDLAKLGNNFRHFDKLFAMTNRLRTEGTEHLLAAADETGVQRFVAQSYRWGFVDAHGTIDPNPPAAFRQSAAALRRLEELVSSTSGGVALRYGGFYGPHTSLDAGGPQIVAVRKRQIPIVGDGGGYFTFLHVHDAATAAVAALTRGNGVYTVVDDEPARVRDWLPYLASVLGAKPPRHVPAWVGRLVAGEGATYLLTQAPPASNARAKEELGWTPRYASWRDGFRAELTGRASAAGG
jgi:nucleoside-diphosphate-sugar epimerase